MFLVEDPLFTVIFMQLHAKLTRPSSTILGLGGPLSEFSQLVGSQISLYNEKRKINVFLTEVRHYATLEEFVEREGWKNLSPYLCSYEDVCDSYLQVCREGGMNALVLTIN